MNDLLNSVSVERVNWEKKLTDLYQDLQLADDRVYSEKKKRWHDVKRHYDKTKSKERQIQNYIEGLEDNKEHLTRKLEEALNEKEAAKKKSERYKRLANQRLKKWHMEKDTRRSVQDLLAGSEHAAKKAEAILDKYKTHVNSSYITRCQMKKEWENEAAATRHGGNRQWPVWVVQLICELLVNGTPPSAVPDNIQTMYEILYGTEPEEMPSVDFVRKCRVIVEVMGETVAAIKLAKAPSWNQLWTDATTRRQIPFTTLIIGLMGDNDNQIDPVVISSCIFMEDKGAETQAAGIIDKVRIKIQINDGQCHCLNILIVFQLNSLKHRLDRLRETMEEEFPGFEYLVPSSDGIDSNKLGNGAAITTDTCNTAQKSGEYY